MKTITYRSYRSGRIWEVRFDLGSDYENCMEALKYAWRNNAEILPS